MPASAIQALPHAVPVKDGETTIALLLPIRKPAKELIDEVFAEVDAAASRRTPEETAALERWLDEKEDG